jgi:hypothetical protein
MVYILEIIFFTETGVGEVIEAKFAIMVWAFGAGDMGGG